MEWITDFLKDWLALIAFGYTLWKDNKDKKTKKKPDKRKRRSQQGKRRK